MTRKVLKLRIPHEVVSLIRGLHPHLKRKIRAALEMLLSEPYAGKVLKNDLSGLRSFRVSRFRIVYGISEKQEIEIVAIGPRQHIYEETYKLVSREDRESSLMLHKQQGSGRLTVHGHKLVHRRNAFPGSHTWYD